jgi:signal transduction histidine kinase/ligand-binding sensor domain-containing protein/AraC-like DNA-binding protein
MHKKLLITLVFIFIGFAMYCIEIQPVKLYNRMSTNSISTILQDNSGFLWLGTDDGLGRYDGYTLEPYSFKNSDSFFEQISVLYKDKKGNILIGTRYGAYRYNQLNTNLTAICPTDMKTYIYCFAEDKSGNIWVGTDAGLYIFDTNFNLIRRLTASKGLSGNKVNDILLLTETSFLIATEHGLNYVVHNKPNSKVTISNVLIQKIELIKAGNVRKIFKDTKGYVWVCVNEEVLRFSSNKIGANQIFSTIAHNIEASVIAQIQNEIWIGSRGQGVERFSITNSVSPVQLETWWIDTSNKSEIKNTILTIYQDKFKNVWIGSLDGFYVYPHIREKPFISLKNSTISQNTPSSNTISSMLVDRYNAVWMATANGLNRFVWMDKQKKTYKIDRFIDSSTPQNLIRDNKLQNIIECEPDVILLSTKSTLRFFNTKSKKFYSEKGIDSQLNSYGMRYAYASCKDKNGNIWFGFSEGGIAAINLKEKKVYKIISTQIDENRHRSIICDKSGAIWFTSDEQGLFRIVVDNDMNIKSVRNFPPKLFDNSFLTALKEDEKGGLWIGGSKGVYKLSTENFEVTKFQNENLRQNFYVKSFIGDTYGNIWVTTLKGIYKISTDNLVEYYEPNPNTYISKAQYIFGSTSTEDGFVFLGGVNGLTIFNSGELHPDLFEVKPCISSFTILGKSIYAVSEKISKDINITDEIVLTHRDFQFSIEFSSMQLFDAQTTKYAYRLVGFDSTWTYTDAQRRITSYSNLKPGKYYFQLRATNSSGKWMKSERELKISVLPAPWKTWWAYSIYIIVLFLIVFFILRSIILFNNLKHKEEITQWKIRYYHNILNTIKTPLSLLQSPLTNIIDNFDNLAVDKIKESLHIIQTNTKRLSHFVKQLVEFRKIDIGKASMNYAEIDIVLFCKSMYDTFLQLTDSKKITFQFNCNVDSKLVIVDVEKMELVLFNLLSNAIKFTNEEGLVQLNCRYDSAGEKVWISVEDNGIGIAKENLNQVFERFWTAEIPDSNSQLRGTGIGLSLVKDFIELHESKITVQSTQTKGSVFKFYISTDKKHLDYLRLAQPVTKKTVKPLYSIQHVGIEKYTTTISKSTNNVNLPIVYCVDSDSDLLGYLKSELEDSYRVELFSTIPEIRKAILRKHPNLIISEAMFVNSTIGFDFCKQLKSDNYTSHILFIILSGLSTEEDKLLAYEYGADAFVSKPFDISFLKVRIQLLLKMHLNVKEKIRNELIVNPKEIDISTNSDMFLANVMNMIEEEYANEKFDVDYLAHHLNITRSMLYRRFKAVVNQSPAEFIKDFRLKRAALLLETTSYNVTEVSEKVGFTDVRYFSKLFKDQFGVLPKSYSMGKKKKK